jgi:Putative Flp pilus-assembly TadE/G-like
MAHIFERLASLGQNRSGSVAAIFAFSMIPLIGIAGAAVDFSRASTASARLKAAADSAVLAALKAKPSDDPVVIGKKVFKGNVDAANDSKVNVTNVILTVNPERTKAKIRFDADVKMTIAAIMKDKVEISGEAEATTAGAQDRSVFFVMDNSLSMQFPIQPGISPPIASDGCIFSCHLTLAETRAKGIVSRLEAGLKAFKSLSDKLKQANSSTQFTAFTSNEKLTKIEGPTTNTNTLSNAFDLLSFESSTHLGDHMATIADLVGKPEKSKQKILILMGDGLESYRYNDFSPPNPLDPNGYPTWLGAPDGTGSFVYKYGPTGPTLPPKGFAASCTALKSSGVKIFTLYTPNYGGYPGEDFNHQPNETVSRNVMCNCASDDGFFVVNSQGTLDKAVEDLMSVLSALRISQ